MFSNRLAVAALGIGCITAAAAGGYLAARQNAVPASATAQTSDTTPAAVPASATPVVTPERPVQETEAVVGDGLGQSPVASRQSPIATRQSPVDSRRSSVASRQSTDESRQPAAKRVQTQTASRPATESAGARAQAGRQEPPPLANTWPASASQQPSAGAVAASSSSPAAVDTTPARADDRAAQEPRAPEPPQKTFEELVVSADSVIGLQTENRLSTETARIEDRVDARVTRDVKVGDRIAIPAGARAIGSVTNVERGGKFKERARLGIRFNMLVLADGTRVPISTETIFRDGDAPGNSSAAKVGGGAVGGAILGAILGGAKGAAIGATTGAAGGTAAVMVGDRSNVVLPPGTPMTVRVLSPVTITTEKN
jgi:hypothetical protein